MISNINFISNLDVSDFPYERIKGCIAALKYLSKNNGLIFNQENMSNIEHIEIKVPTHHVNPITEETSIIESDILKLTVDNKEKKVYKEAC